MEDIRGKAQARAAPRETTPHSGRAFWTKTISVADAVGKLSDHIACAPSFKRHKVLFPEGLLLRAKSVAQAACAGLSRHAYYGTDADCACVLGIAKWLAVHQSASPN